MTLVSDADRRRIGDAITEAERTTSGEIVAVIAPRELGSYLYVPVAVGGTRGAGGALALRVLDLVADPAHLSACSWPSSPCWCAVLMPLPARLALVPRSVKHDRAHRRAVEQFLAQDLHTTVGRTGVLIFVSVAERFAEVLADAAIHERVPQAVWRSIVDDLTDALGRGEPPRGSCAPSPRWASSWPAISRPTPARTRSPTT